MAPASVSPLAPQSLDDMAAPEAVRPERRHHASVLAVIAAAAGLLLGLAAGIASAGAHPAYSVRLSGGTTAVTTSPGIAVALLKNGIVPLATRPGREVVKYRHGQVAVKFAFSVTGAR
jgi:hypothetical protein